MLKAENQNLQRVNETLNKCQKAKKTCLQDRGSLSQQDTQDLLDKKDIVLQVEQEIKASSSYKLKEELCVWCCSNYSKTGHNACTC